MPFNDNLPQEGTDPWYAPLVTAWTNLKTFVNGLETALGGKLDASEVSAELAGDQDDSVPRRDGGRIKGETAVDGDDLVNLDQLDGLLEGKVDTSSLGRASGVATLDSSGKVPSGQLPSGGGGGAVASVNGKTGAVALTQDDIADGTTAKQFTAAEETKLTGIAAGATANDTDVNLKNRANHTGVQAISTVSGLQAALDARATLVGGVIPTNQLPPLAINEVFPAANQAAMLALTAQRGDIAIREDNGKTFILATDSPATLADWKEVVASGQVLSVAGKTGIVALAKADVGLGNVDNTSDANKPVSSATQTALNAKAPLASPAFTGTPTGITKGHVGLSNVDNTSDENKPVSVAQAAAISAKVGSPNSTITGIAYYPTVGSLPATGEPGVIYVVDQE